MENAPVPFAPPQALPDRLPVQRSLEVRCDGMTLKRRSGVAPRRAMQPAPRRVRPVRRHLPALQEGLRGADPERRMKIDVMAGEPHFVDHIAPIWLRPSGRGPRHVLLLRQGRPAAEAIGHGPPHGAAVDPSDADGLGRRSPQVAPPRPPDGDHGARLRPVLRRRSPGQRALVLRWRHRAERAALPASRPASGRPRPRPASRGPYRDRRLRPPR